VGAQTQLLQRSRTYLSISTLSRRSGESCYAFLSLHVRVPAVCITHVNSRCWVVSNHLLSMVHAMHCTAGHSVLCLYAQAPVYSHAAKSSSSRSSVSCRVSRGAGDLPVVEDATVLPPPPTGSQYAWRRSWAGAGANSSGSAGNGGAGEPPSPVVQGWCAVPASSGLAAQLGAVVPCMCMPEQQAPGISTHAGVCSNRSFWHWQPVNGYGVTLTHNTQR
jgi:hypothetical protein